MDTSFSLSESEDALRDGFLSKPSHVENAGRRHIGDAATTSYGTQRGELRLSYERQTCVLTLWGDKAINFSQRNDVIYTIKCIVPTNDCNHQRCYNSTADTKFKVLISLISHQTSFGLDFESLSHPVHLLCTKHLKDNVRRYLKDKEGCSTKDGEFIVSSIFGRNGVLNCDDSFSYDSKIADLDSYLNKFPHFKSYFQTRLKPLLDKYVFLPLQKGPVTEQWTNNNCESMNNRLKQSLDWRPHKLPDLITKINEISAFQINDLRRAIHGNGNYILEDTLQQHRVPPDVWVKMSQLEKKEENMETPFPKPD
uniref:Uncharacterized protein n=1 Tax=Magallana gigas TaxID=29159 RepID=A0A8W8N5E3_MAGGI